MISCEKFYSELQTLNINFFTGVPDSLLKDICAFISDNVPSVNHIIAANEGSAISIASGYHMATGNIPMVYFQNSGLGNSINPLLSLADQEVYSIPMILLIGWRGEPYIKDEPQHIKQGRVQNSMLESMEIPYRILDSKQKDFSGFMNEIAGLVEKHQAPVAIVVRKSTFATYKLKNEAKTSFEMNREMAIQILLDSVNNESLIVSTTGKASRELFEYRAHSNFGHQNDFLTVGSMGHCSQIALGIAMKSKKQIICLDGDGAIIMHMGSMAIIGQNAPENFLHIVINNGSHDSVGGQPTVGFNIDFPKIALACGYEKARSVSKINDLKNCLAELTNESGPVFLEVKVNKGARIDLGRPTTTPIDNKKVFMKKIKE